MGNSTLPLTVKGVEANEDEDEDEEDWEVSGAGVEANRRAEREEEDATIGWKRPTIELRTACIMLIMYMTCVCFFSCVLGVCGVRMEIESESETEIGLGVG